MAEICLQYIDRVAQNCMNVGSVIMMILTVLNWPVLILGHAEFAPNVYSSMEDQHTTDYEEQHNAFTDEISYSRTAHIQQVYSAINENPIVITQRYHKEASAHSRVKQKDSEQFITLGIIDKYEDNTSLLNATYTTHGQSTLPVHTEVLPLSSVSFTSVINSVSSVTTVKEQPDYNPEFHKSTFGDSIVSYKWTFENASNISNLQSSIQSTISQIRSTLSSIEASSQRQSEEVLKSYRINNTKREGNTTTQTSTPITVTQMPPKQVNVLSNSFSLSSTTLTHILPSAINEPTVNDINIVDIDQTSGSHQDQQVSSQFLNDFGANDETNTKQNIKSETIRTPSTISVDTSDKASPSLLLKPSQFIQPSYNLGAYTARVAPSLRLHSSSPGVSISATTPISTFLNSVESSFSITSEQSVNETFVSSTRFVGLLYPTSSVVSNSTLSALNHIAKNLSPTLESQSSFTAFKQSDVSSLVLDTVPPSLATYDTTRLTFSRSTNKFSVEVSELKNSKESPPSVLKLIKSEFQEVDNLSRLLSLEVTTATKFQKSVDTSYSKAFQDSTLNYKKQSVTDSDNILNQSRVHTFQVSKIHSSGSNSVYSKQSKPSLSTTLYKSDGSGEIYVSYSDTIESFGSTPSIQRFATDKGIVSSTISSTSSDIFHLPETKLPTNSNNHFNSVVHEENGVVSIHHSIPSMVDSAGDTDHVNATPQTLVTDDVKTKSLINDSSNVLSPSSPSYTDRIIQSAVSLASSTEPLNVSSIEASSEIGASFTPSSSKPETLFHTDKELSSQTSSTTMILPTKTSLHDIPSTIIENTDNNTHPSDISILQPSKSSFKSKAVPGSSKDGALKPSLIPMHNTTSSQQNMVSSSTESNSLHQTTTDTITLYTSYPLESNLDNTVRKTPYLTVSGTHFPTLEKSEKISGIEISGITETVIKHFPSSKEIQASEMVSVSYDSSTLKDFKDDIQSFSSSLVDIRPSENVSLNQSSIRTVSDIDSNSVSNSSNNVTLHTPSFESITPKLSTYAEVPKASLLPIEHDSVSRPTMSVLSVNTDSSKFNPIPTYTFNEYSDTILKDDPNSHLTSILPSDSTYITGESMLSNTLDSKTLSSEPTTELSVAMSMDIYNSTLPPEDSSISIYDTSIPDQGQGIYPSFSSRVSSDNQYSRFQDHHSMVTKALLIPTPPMASETLRASVSSINKAWSNPNNDEDIDSQNDQIGNISSYIRSMPPSVPLSATSTDQLSLSTLQSYPPSFQKSAQITKTSTPSTTITNTNSPTGHAYTDSSQATELHASHILFPSAIDHSSIYTSSSVSIDVKTKSVQESNLYLDVDTYSLSLINEDSLANSKQFSTTIDGYQSIIQSSSSYTFESLPTAVHDIDSSSEDFDHLPTKRLHTLPPLFTPEQYTHTPQTHIFSKLPGAGYVSTVLSTKLKYSTETKYLQSNAETALSSSMHESVTSNVNTDTLTEISSANIPISFASMSSMSSSISQHTDDSVFSSFTMLDTFSSWMMEELTPGPTTIIVYETEPISSLSLTSVVITQESAHFGEIIDSTPKLSTSIPRDSDIISAVSSTPVSTTDESSSSSKVITSPFEQSSVITASKSIPSIESSLFPGILPVATFPAPTTDPTDSTSELNILVICIQVKLSVDVFSRRFRLSIERGLLKCYHDGLERLGRLTTRHKRDTAAKKHNTGALTYIQVLDIARRDWDGRAVDITFSVVVAGRPLHRRVASRIFDQLSLVESSALIGYPVLGKATANVITAPPSTPMRTPKLTTSTPIPTSTSPPTTTLTPPAPPADESFFSPLTIAIIVVPFCCACIAAAAILYIYYWRPRRHGYSKKAAKRFSLNSLRKQALKDFDLVIDVENAKSGSKKSTKVVDNGYRICGDLMDDDTTPLADTVTAIPMTIPDGTGVIYDNIPHVGYQETIIDEKVLNSSHHTMPNVTGNVTYDRTNERTKMKLTNLDNMQCKTTNTSQHRYNVSSQVSEKDLKNRLNASSNRNAKHINKHSDLNNGVMNTLTKKQYTSKISFNDSAVPTLTKNEGFEAVSELSASDNEMSDAESFDSKEAYDSGEEADTDTDTGRKKSRAYNTDNGMRVADSYDDIMRQLRERSPLREMPNYSFRAKRTQRRTSIKENVFENNISGNASSDFYKELPRSKRKRHTGLEIVSSASNIPTEGYCNKVLQEPFYSSLTLTKNPRKVNNFIEGDIEDEVFLPDGKESVTGGVKLNRALTVSIDGDFLEEADRPASNRKPRPTTNGEMSAMQTSELSPLTTTPLPDYCVPWDLFGFRFDKLLRRPDSQSTEGSEFAGDEFETVNYRSGYPSSPSRAGRLQPTNPSNPCNQPQTLKSKMSAEMCTVSPAMFEHVTKMSRVGNRQASSGIKSEFGPQFRQIPVPLPSGSQPSTRSVTPIDSFKALPAHVNNLLLNSGAEDNTGATVCPRIVIESPSSMVTEVALQDVVGVEPDPMKTHCFNMSMDSRLEQPFSPASSQRSRRSSSQPYEEMKLGRNMRAAPRGSLAREVRKEESLDNVKVYSNFRHNEPVGFVNQSTDNQQQQQQQQQQQPYQQQQTRDEYHRLAVERLEESVNKMRNCNIDIGDPAPRQDDSLDFYSAPKQHRTKLEDEPVLGMNAPQSLSGDGNIDMKDPAPRQEDSLFYHGRIPHRLAGGGYAPECLPEQTYGLKPVDQLGIFDGQSQQSSIPAPPWMGPDQHAHDNPNVTEFLVDEALSGSAAITAPDPEDLYSPSPKKAPSVSADQGSTQPFSPRGSGLFNPSVGESSSSSMVMAKADDGVHGRVMRQETTEGIDDIEEEIEIEANTDNDKMSDDDFKF